MKTYYNILENMKELETMLLSVKREVSDATEKDLLESVNFNYSFTLFRYRKFFAIKELKLFEKSIPEKMDILYKVLDGEYDFGIEDYDYWNENLYTDCPRRHQAKIDFRDYELAYQTDSFNEDEFNEFYTEIIGS